MFKTHLYITDLHIPYSTSHPLHLHCHVITKHLYTNMPTCLFHFYCISFHLINQFVKASTKHAILNLLQKKKIMMITANNYPLCCP